MENSFIDDSANAVRSEGLPFDFKRVLFRALRYWYFVAICLLLAAAYGYFTVRYTTKIFPVSASIIIKEAEETGGAELLYNNALVNQYRNYLNEPYIIRSFPLIRSVVEDLNYDIRFYREGRLQTSDAYDYIPVIAYLNRHAKTHPTTGIFTIISSTQFTLQPTDGSSATSAGAFNFGDTIHYDGNTMVLQKRNKYNDKEFLNVPFLMDIKNTEMVTEQYAGSIDVTWAEVGAGVINLTINGSNVGREEDFLAGLISRYQQNDLDKKNQTAIRTIDFISNEIRSLSDSMRIVEGHLEVFKNIGQGTDLGEKAERLLTQLTAIEKDKTEFLIKENYYGYLDSYLKNGANLDQIILPSAMGISDGVVSDLITSLERMQLDIKLGKTMNKEENSILMDKQLRINQIKKDIVEALATLRATDKLKLDLINKQLKTIEDQLARLPSTERQYVSIKRNFSLMENLYIFLMQKLSEAKISRASNLSDIIVVNSPRKSGGAITPKPGQTYGIALAIGILFPFLFFIGAEVLNNRIQSKEDIEKLTQIPFIGGVGHTQNVSNLVVHERPRSSVAESYRALRSNISFFTGTSDKKVFMITSSIGGEGKTFTTVNLATVLALSNSPTLIVGADMRKPKLFGDFGLENKKGLSSYLSGLSTFEEVIQPTTISGLDLISGGPVPPNPSELLMTSAMENFFVEAFKRYKYIVLDTPPIAVVSDAFLLTRFSDHIIFVTRQNYSPKHFLKIIQQYYKDGRLTKISILLNDINKTGPGYGYNGYGYDYGYSYGYGEKKKGYGYYSEGEDKKG